MFPVDNPSISPSVPISPISTPPEIPNPVQAPKKRQLTPTHPKAKKTPAIIHPLNPTGKTRSTIYTDATGDSGPDSVDDTTIGNPDMPDQTPHKPGTTNTPSILNLSSKPLTEEDIEVLTLGLKFGPTFRQVPDPLEYFDKYHDQCQHVYAKLTNKPGTAPTQSHRGTLSGHQKQASLLCACGRRTT